jgi:hypothetical protein
MGNCSSTSKCNPCGPNYDAINLLANKTASYARQANTSAVDAANSATDAENYWKEFNALYLGSFASAPTVDNEGNPLQEGALYFNSVSNQMFVWQGASWIDFDFDEFTPFLATGTPTARNLVTRTADIFNVKDFGAVGNGTTDNQAAFQAAINAALAAGGGTIYIPKGTYWFPHIGTSQAILDVGIGNLTFKGDGDSTSILKFSEGTLSNPRILFENTTNNPAKGELNFFDFQIQGTLDVNPGRFGQPMFLDYYPEITIKNCKFYNIAGVAMDLHYCGSFKCIDSFFENIGADAIRARDTSDCIVIGNTIKTTGDDPIALHTATGTLLSFTPQRERMIVANNILINCAGKSVAIGAKKIIFSGNQLHLSGPISVSSNYLTSEGNNPMYDISVIGNTITDAYQNGQTTMPYNVTAGYNIILTLQMAKAGSSTNNIIPGDYNPTTGKIVYPWYYTQTSGAVASNSIPRTSGINICNNTISRTKAATVFTDFGEGQRLSQGVYTNPNVLPLEGGNNGVGIAVFGNAENINISSNNIRNCQIGIFLAPDNQSTLSSPERYSKLLKNGLISNNVLYDCYAVGIQFSITGIGTVDLLITNNVINCDPYRINAKSNINGTYIGSPGPQAFQTFNARGFVIKQNKFKNCYTMMGGISSWLDFIFTNNTIYLQPIAPFGLTNNKGIADIYILNQAGENEIIVEDSDPTSATYLDYISTLNKYSTAQPTSGWYYAGWVVKNANPILDANGMTISGWTRLTTGTGHVAGVDWAVARVSNVSPAT